MSEDYRRYPRFARNEQVIYSIDDPSYETDRLHLLGTVTNFSDGGLALRTATPHETGEELRFEAVEGTKRTEQLGRVCWCKELPEEEAYEIGIEFY